MAIEDLTGNLRNKKFEGGVGGGASPVAYSGPDPVNEGENVSAEALEATVQGIYEKYGRSAKGIRMAKASPEYAALKAAGISVFGTPTARTETDRQGNTRLVGGTTTLKNASPEAKAKAGAQYAALQGYGSGYGRTARTAASSLSDRVGSSAEMTAPQPRENSPRTPESTAQTAQSTSLSDATRPPASQTKEAKPSDTQTQETPTSPTASPSTIDTTKGRRFTTSRDYNDNKPKTETQILNESQGPARKAMQDNLAARDKINRQSLRGGSSGITVQDAIDLGYGSGLDPKDGGRMLDNSDASVQMMRAAERNNLQAEREEAAKEYNSQAAAAYRADEFKRKQAGWQTEAGDKQTEMQTGEVQDRSQFGGTKVYKRETYKGPGGKEFVGNWTSEGFIGLPSKRQNEADTYNRGMIENKGYDRDADKSSGEEGYTTYNRYELDGKGGGVVGRGRKGEFYVGPDNMDAVKGQLPSEFQKGRFGEDVKRFTTGTASPAEGSDLTEKEYRKKKSEFVGPLPRA
ncbi:MAG: hypothetical protein EBU08_08745 [Micrococcales bacterium]|nr:hypothetical protein [Micrococcales bacterium]